MASPVIDLAHLTGRRLVVVQELADGLIQRLRQDLDLLVSCCVGDVFQ